MQFARQEFLERFEKVDAELDIIPGNHDQYFRNVDDVVSLKELVRGYKNIRVHLEPTEMEVYGKKILMLPWICDSNIEISISMIKNTSATLCFAHLELEGFEMDKGNICDHGMSAALFQKFHWVGTGHFHHPSSKGNIHYIGSPWEMTWHDYQSPKGFTVMDMETLNWNKIPNNFSIFQVYEYDDSLGDEILKEDFSRFTDTHVKIRIINKTNEYLYDLVMEKLNSQNPIKVAIIDDPSIFSAGANNMIDVMIADSTPVIIDTYIDKLQLENKTNPLKLLLSDLYKEALSLETID